jgi:hypothetical protein
MEALLMELNRLLGRVFETLLVMQQLKKKGIRKVFKSMSQ